MKKTTYQLICRSLRKLSPIGLIADRESIDDSDFVWQDSASHLVVLEDRVLYDAAPFDIEMSADTGAMQDADAALEMNESVDWAEVVTTGSEQLQQQALELLDFADEILATELSVDETVLIPELVVVDTLVDDYEGLLAEITESGNVEVLYVESNQNGFEQVSKKLNELGQVSAVHILSHGNDGQLTLGNASLSLETLDSYSDELTSWQAGLAENADLLFYGCDLASDGDGQMLLSHIVDLTNADVAASADLTGHSDLGGDWILEFESGNIQTEVIVSQLAQAEWGYSLALAGIGGVESVGDTETVFPAGVTAMSTARENRGSSDAVAMDANGNYVVVWSADTVSDAWEVRAQKYDSLGNTVGSEILVNESVTGDQRWASVAMDDAGDFVVTWSDVNSGEAMGRYFGAAGFDSGEFVLGVGEDSSVTMNASGQYAFAWEGSGPTDTNGVYASFYDSDHSAIREQFLVNTTTFGFQGDVDISINSHGELVAVWESSSNVYAQRLAVDGSHLGAEDFALSFHYDPSVKLRDDGHFIVAVTNNIGNEGVRGGVFDANNVLVEYLVINQSLDGQQVDASIALTSDTEFVITWSGPGDRSGQEDSSGGVYAARYDYDGAALTTLENETLVNTYTPGVQENASIAAIASDHYVIVWDGAGDGVTDGVFHKLVAPVNSPPTIVNAMAYPTENIDLTLQLWNFGYQDSNGDPLAKVLITEVPREGELYLDGALVTDGLEIDVNDITAGKLVYHQTTSGYGVDFDRTRFKVHDGTEYSANDADMEFDVMSRNVLWLTTDNDVSGASDVPGPDSWESGDVLQFGGANLELGNSTDGYFTIPFELDDYVNEEIDALHYVTQSVTIGTGSQMTLNEGDVVFAVAQDVFLPGITDIVEDNDIVVFQPTSGDYSSGVFTLLFDYSSVPVSADMLNFADLDALTIVEKNTQVGDTFLLEGQIIFGVGNSGGNDNDIFVMTLDDVGMGTTDGSSSLLIDGADITIGNQIDGLELVERNSTVGGFDLAGGTLLVSVNSSEAVGNNTRNVSDADIFALDIVSTSVNGAAQADAQKFFDGSDVNFSNNSEFDVNGFSVLSYDTPLNLDPLVDDQTFSIVENSPNGTVVGSVVASDPNVGDGVLFQVIGGSGAGIFDVDPLTGEIFVTDSNSLDYELAITHSLHISVTDGDGLVDAASMTIDLVNEPENIIAGNIFNDVNANGDVIDEITPAFDGATVHLYEDVNGDMSFDAGDVLIRTSLTDADGHYVFDDLDNGNFFVVVDSTTLTPFQGFNGANTVADVWAEQTYGSAGSLFFDGIGDNYTSEDGVLFGGRTATGSDDHGDMATMEHVTLVTVSFSDEVDIDFGFSFNVVTNLEGGDIAAVNGQTAQGSFRQFIINANSIVGANEMRFVPVVDANQVDRETWQIDIVEALPEILDGDTIINGQAWSAADGISEIDHNADIIGVSGTTVGINDFALSMLDRPELELINGAAVSNGLTVAANDVVISGMRIEGFGTSFLTGNVVVNGAHDFVLQESHLFGAVDANLVVDFGSDGGTIANNVIESGGGFGISFEGTNGSISDWHIYENYILNNGSTFVYGDGIDARSDTSATIERNLFSGQLGSGIDSYANSGSGLVITENTVIGNGVGGVETSGIRLMGSNHEVSENVIQNNAGAGVYVVADGPATVGASNFNEISANEFGNNGGIAIDLGETANIPSDLHEGDGVSDFSTPNLSAGNMGLQSPELTSSTFDSGTTTVEGTAGPNQRIEIYSAVADVDDSDTQGGESFGEGIQYLGWTMSDGSGNFSFATTQLGIDDVVSAIAIDAASNTSEFSANLEVNVAPVTEDFLFTVASGEAFDFATRNFAFLDADSDTFDGVLFNTVPGPGQLFNGTVLIGDGEFVSAADIAAGNLHYVAPDGMQGNPLESITFQVSDGNALSELHVIDVNVTNDSPVIDTPSAVDIDENDTSFTVTASDPDLDDLTFSIEGGDDDAHFDIDPLTGEVTFNVAPDFENPHDDGGNNVYELVVGVTDTAGNYSDKLFTINVQPVNEHPPVITSPSLYSFEENDIKIQVVVEANDDDLPGNPLSWSIDPAFEDGTLFSMNPVTGDLEMNIVPDYEDPVDFGNDNKYCVRVYVTDGLNVTSQEITFDVQPLNDNAQVITTPVHHDVDEGDAFVAQVEFSDDDVDTPSTVAFSLLDGVGDSDQFTIDPVTGELSFNVAPNFEAPTDANTNNTYNVWVQTDDGDGNLDVKRLRVHVQDVNEAITGLDLNPADVDENSAGGTSVGFVDVSDEDQNDTFRFTLEDDAGGRFTIDPVTGEVSVLPNADLNFEIEQSHEIIVKVVDDASHEWTKSVTIDVNNVNEAPVASNLHYDSVLEGGNLFIDDSEFDSIVDPDGDSLRVMVFSGPQHGTIVETTNGFVYRHDGSENHFDSVIYEIYDGNGGSDRGVITIQMDPVNDAPIAFGEQIIHDGDGAMFIAESVLLANDWDPDSGHLDVVVVNGPSTGQFTVTADGSWIFVPDENTPAIETVEYVVTDGQGNSRVVTADLVIPFQVPDVEDAVEEPVTGEEEPDPVPTETEGPVGGENDPDGNESTDVTENTGPIGNNDFDGNGTENKANDIETDQTGLNSSLSDNSLLFANYGFTYQKSSVDLSQLPVQSDSSGFSRLVDNSDAFATQLIGSMFDGLDQVNEEIMENISSATGKIRAAASLTGLATAVYVLWMARGGMLVASVVSSMPAWQSFDPLPILQYSAEDIDPDADDDSIESLLDRE